MTNEIPKLLAYIEEQRQMIDSLTVDLLTASRALDFVLTNYVPAEFDRAFIINHIREKHSASLDCDFKEKNENTHT